MRTGVGKVTKRQFGRLVKRLNVKAKAWKQSECILKVAIEQDLDRSTKDSSHSSNCVANNIASLQ